MVGDEFYYPCRGTSKDPLLLEKIMNAFREHQGSISSVVEDLSYDTELSVDLTASSLGAVVSDYKESYLLYGDEGMYYIVPKMNEPIKVVFDTHEDGDCVEYGRENIWGVFEWDIDVATDEEIKDLLEVK